MSSLSGFAQATETYGRLETVPDKKEKIQPDRVRDPELKTFADANLSLFDLLVELAMI